MSAGALSDVITVSTELLVARDFVMDTGDGTDTVNLGVETDGTITGGITTSTGSITIDLGSSDTGSSADYVTLLGSLVAETDVDIDSGDGADIQHNRWRHYVQHRFDRHHTVDGVGQGGIERANQSSQSPEPFT